MVGSAETRVSSRHLGGSMLLVWSQRGSLLEGKCVEVGDTA
jgi:hypothetical protein